MSTVKQDFEIVGKLSSGTYGDVFLITIGTKYHALKICTLTSAQNHQLIHFLRDSIREFFFAQCLLSTHVLGYFVREYQDKTVRLGIAQSLALSNLFQLGTLSIQQLRAYFKDVVVQLTDLHAQGILHRDIKPENILQMQTGRMLLTDPSLCIRHNAPQNPNVITLWYRPPELLLEAEPCTSASDVWSLGITILDTINKRPIFTKISTEAQMIQAIGCYFGCSNTDPEWYQKKVRRQMPQMTTFSIDESLQDLLQQMLKIRPTERISMQAVLQHPFWTRQTPIQIVPIGSTTIRCTKTSQDTKGSAIQQCKVHSLANQSSVETRLLVLDTFLGITNVSKWPLRVVLSAMYLWDIYATARKELCTKQLILACLLFCAASIETDEEQFRNLKVLISESDLPRFQSCMIHVLGVLGPILPPIWKHAQKCRSEKDLVVYALGPNIWSEEYNKEDLDELVQSSCFSDTYISTFL